jgi:hypothetical protein
MKDKLLVIMTFVLGINVGSCGKLYSDDAAAVIIRTDQPGYTCFVIRDESGKAVGGNCIKN